MLILETFYQMHCNLFIYLFAGQTHCNQILHFDNHTITPSHQILTSPHPHIPSRHHPFSSILINPHPHIPLPHLRSVTPNTNQTHLHMSYEFFKKRAS